MPDLRQDITAALADFQTLPLKDASRHLLARLGYKSDKFLAGAGSRPQDFLNDFASVNPLDEEKALVAEWKSADLVFQLTDQELSRESTLFTDDSVQRSLLKSYVFIAIELREANYARGKFSAIARQINRLFPMPVMVLFKHGERLTIAVINRRRNKIDESKDVLEKATLIRDVSIPNPHRGHLDILASLALPKLVHPEKKPINDFDTLHAAWEQIFNIELLNERFYKELSNWYFWALPQVDFPDDLEKNGEKSRATGLIRLLTRLIFCWFLKEKDGLIPEKLFHPAELAKLLKGFDPESETSSTYYLAILQNLFFATLNQRMGKDGNGKSYRFFATDEGFQKNRATHDVNTLYRYENLFAVSQEEAIALFAEIPFLNGGLFECLDRTEDGTNKKLYLDGFSRNPKRRPHVPDRLFFDSGETADLSEVYGDKKRKSERVTGLITILNRYKFTIVENTPIDQEIALDPELLGKVFENLLASYNEETKTTARKQTGSFYTPRPIVDYMVDESLKSHLLNTVAAVYDRRTSSSTSESSDAHRATLQKKLDHLFAYTEDVPDFSELEKATLITAIDALKILDPACGSGAFPMGVLHKLVYILGKLDPANDRWRQTQLAKLDSAPMREELERAFADNNDDYGRKLYLIENCLYGVDIQPIAIQITKLRFFISLVCDQKTNRNKKENHGIRPLPNLETKFVAANTLIGLPIPEPDLFLKSLIEPIEKEIETAYHGHFTIQRRDQKLALQKKIKTLRQKLTDTLLDGLGANKGSEVAKKAQHLADWDPFDPQSSADFFDPHWMFGRSLTDGFNIVIGNPPYVSKQALQKQAPDFAAYARTTFKSAMGRDFDLFALFIEKSVSLLRPQGVLCWIVPTGWYTGPGFSELRRFVVQHTDPRLFINLPYDMFEEAWVDTTLFLATRRAEIVRWPRSESCEAMLKTFAKREQLNDPSDFVNGAAFVNISTWFKNGEDQFLTRSDENVLTLLQKIRKASVPLGDCADVQRGVTPFHLTDAASHPNSALAFDGTVRRYTATLGTPRYLRYDESLAEYKPERYFKGPRILLRELISRQMRLQAALVTLDCVSNKSMQTILPKPEQNPSYLLGVLNSSLLSWYFLQRSNVGHRDDFPKIVLKETRDLPIPMPGSIAWSDKSHDQIVTLVGHILASKQANPAADTSALEREIDLQVYALYGLTPEEIAIVEGTAP